MRPVRSALTLFLALVALASSCAPPESGLFGLKAAVGDTVDLLAARQHAPSTCPAQGRKGIAMSVGTQAHVDNALVSISLLRNKWRSQLPVTLFHWGDEISADVQEHFRALFDDVHFRDLSLMPRPLSSSCDHNPTGYALKALAIYQSRQFYESLLWLDADSFLLGDPENLFNSTEYQQFGSMFWPDFWQSGWVDPAIYFFLTEGQHEPLTGTSFDTESGQLLLNTCAHQDVLEFLWTLNENAAITYKHMLGDKDTFRLAFALAGKLNSFYQSPVAAGAAFTSVATSTELQRLHNEFAAQHSDADLAFGDCDGLPAMMVGMLQYSPWGELSFFHRTNAEYSLQHTTQIRTEFVLPPGVLDVARMWQAPAPSAGWAICPEEYDAKDRSSPPTTILGVEQLADDTLSEFRGSVDSGGLNGYKGLATQPASEAARAMQITRRQFVSVEHLSCECQGQHIIEHANFYSNYSNSDCENYTWWQIENGYAPLGCNGTLDSNGANVIDYNRYLNFSNGRVFFNDTNAVNSSRYHNFSSGLVFFSDTNMTNHTNRSGWVIRTGCTCHHRQRVVQSRYPCNFSINGSNASSPQVNRSRYHNFTAGRYYGGTDCLNHTNRTNFSWYSNFSQDCRCVCSAKAANQCSCTCPDTDNSTVTDTAPIVRLTTSMTVVGVDANQWSSQVIVLFQDTIIEADIYGEGVTLGRKDVTINSLARRDTTVQFTINTGGTVDISGALLSFLTDAGAAGFVQKMNQKCSQSGVTSFSITGISDVSVSAVGTSEEATSNTISQAWSAGHRAGLIAGVLLCAGALLLGGAFFASGFSARVIRESPSLSIGVDKSLDKSVDKSFALAATVDALDVVVDSDLPAELDGPPPYPQAQGWTEVAGTSSASDSD